MTMDKPKVVWNELEDSEDEECEPLVPEDQEDDQEDQDKNFQVRDDEDVLNR